MSRSVQPIRIIGLTTNAYSCLPLKNGRPLVIVLDSADPDYIVAHFDVVRGGEVPDQPGAARFS